MANDTWPNMPFTEAVVVNPPVPLEKGKVYPFVDMASLNPAARSVQESEHREFTGGGSRFIPGDTLMARITPCLENGKIARFRPTDGASTGFGSTEFIVIRGRDGVTDNDFAYYLTKWNEFRQFAVAQMVGTSGRQRVPAESLAHFAVAVPPLPIQRRIAAVLGALDDKIELNRRMNRTLEAMARALFKSWFVDFEPVRAKMDGRWKRGHTLPGLPPDTYDLWPDRLVASELGEIPEGWEVGALGKFFVLGLGGVWGEDEPSTRATVAVRCLRGIDCHDLAEGRIPEMPTRWVSPKQAADRELMDGTILIEGSGSFCGRSMVWRRCYEALLGAPVGYSNFCKRLDPRCTAAQAAICWLQMRQSYRDGLLQSFRTGTAFPNLDVRGALSNLIVVVPPVPLAEAFDEMFTLSQRLDLMAQSRTVAGLRDALLPKLLSGEIDVSALEGLAEGVAETARPVKERSTETRAETVIYTIGHSNHQIDRFIGLLRRHGITAIADVRSAPYSRHNPQFNTKALAAALKKAGIAYVFLGEELGARPKDPACYNNGRVDFGRLAAREEFARGIERVLKGSEKYRLALMCAEKEPLDCHRTILVCRHLREQGVGIRHILADGSVEDHRQTEARLLKATGLEPTLFAGGGDSKAIEQAYARRAGEIAYKTEKEEPTHERG